MKHSHAQFFFDEKKTHNNVLLKNEMGYMPFRTSQNSTTSR